MFRKFFQLYPTVRSHHQRLVFRRTCQHSPNKLANFNISRKENIRNLLQTEPSPQLYLVQGWARLVKRQKLTSFVHLDDGSSGQRLQIVIPNQLLTKQNKKLYSGTSLSCTGRLVPSSGRKQNIELLCESIHVVGDCDPGQFKIGSYIDPTKNLDTLREMIHLRPRTRYFQSTLRIRSELQNAVHIFMKQNGFLNVTSPIITANDCEGGGQCFTIKPLDWPSSDESSDEKLYFGRPTYLTVSSQLHLEALASAMSRVYTLSPVFRAEKSMSPKHLSEFLMLEAEESFLDSLDSLLDRVESLCKFSNYYLQSNCDEDVQFLCEQNRDQFGTKPVNLDKPFVRMSYRDAVKLLRGTGKFSNILDSEYCGNLNAEMERTLVQLMDLVPVFVTHFPFPLKPFYMKSDEENQSALCFDLLMPICGEVCGGSLREDNIQKLQSNISEREMSDTNLDWYFDLRRFGGAPSGGFGLGFDRFIQTLTGITNIKDVCPFPRWPYHCHL